MKRKIFTILCAVLILMQFALAAFAVDQIDMSRDGSISINMLYDGKPVAGGTITIYRVAEVICVDADYDFKFVNEFVGCGLSLDSLTSPSLAKSLFEVATNKGAEGSRKNIDENGFAKFEDLELGLYLVVQETNAEGYYAFSPFLVTVPTSQNGVYKYDVDASPKVAVEPKPTETTEETTTPTTEETTAPTTEETTAPTTEETTAPTTEETTAPTTEETTAPTTEETTAPTTEETTAPTTEETTAPTTEETTEETTESSTTGTTVPKIPQTGQMNWPVPVFAVAGIAVFVLGWCLHRSEKKNDNEA